VRICIYGAGAGGGHFAVRLALAGNDVSVVARGDHLAAIKDHGLTLVSGDQRLTARVQASDQPGELGQQDLVVVAVKATGLASVADGLAPLVGPQTVVAFPQNGMAWWYPDGLPADKPAPPDLPIFRLGQRFRRILGADRILGGTIYSGNEVVAPGVINNSTPTRNGLSLGTIVAGAEPPLAPIRAAFVAAGIDSPAIDDIRLALWKKLLVNMSGSSIALAVERPSSICRIDAALGQTYRRVVQEGMAIARGHGYSLDDVVDPERMIAGLHDHKPSLLQDFERGRAMEIAEIVEAPAAFAHALGISCPTLETIAAIVARRARDRGLVPDL